MINKRQYQEIHGKGQSQDEIDRRWNLFEREQAAFNQQISGGGGRGCVNTPSYQTITDTVWIYPPADVEYALLNTSIPYTQVGNTLYFDNITDMGDVYDEIFLRTEVTQPNGNTGYSLGVGTILLDLYTELYFKLNITDELIVTWRLTNQLTNQNSLPVGGNSPQGTTGYLTTYEDWPVGQRPQYYDPVLITTGPTYCV